MTLMQTDFFVYLVPCEKKHASWNLTAAFVLQFNVQSHTCKYLLLDIEAVLVYLYQQKLCLQLQAVQNSTVLNIYSL